VKPSQKRNWGALAALILFPLALIGIIWVILHRPNGDAPPVDPQAQIAIDPQPFDPQANPARPPNIPVLPPGPKPPVALAEQITAIGHAFPGNAGIAVTSVDKGWTASFAGDQIFPQQSVSKLWVSAAILDKVDKGEISLDDTIPLTPRDLTIFHQPIRKYIMAGNYAPTISELMRYAMTQSDNTANDVLYRKAGGQQGVGGFIARKTLGQIAIGPGEKILQTEMAGLQWDDSFSYDRTFWQVRGRLPPEARSRALSRYLASPPDGATPMAIATGLTKLQKGELLTPKSSAILLSLMSQSKTGPDRLRGAITEGSGWSMAHKTGTGQVLGSIATAYNDVGILNAPSGKSYAVVVMIGSTQISVKARQEMMHLVMQAVMRCDVSQGC
jgi:beta-lactamase class A